jgi:hypothetical protein
MKIKYSGQLLDHMIAAAQAHGTGPMTRLIVREGTLGPEREIAGVKVRHGPLGLEMIIETEPKPVGH